MHSAARGVAGAVAAALAMIAGSAQAQLVRSAAGSDAASIQDAVDAFRNDLGTLNPNVPGTFGSGRREINWDGVPDTAAAPNAFPANFFNVNSPRGVVFSTPGTGFAVSADSDNPTMTPVRFANIDPAFSTRFATFSPQRLFTALGSTITDVSFFIPGSDTPASVRGFGSVFTGVNTEGVSRIDYFSGDQLLDSFDVPAHEGDGELSFLGVSFADPVITRVRIFAGTMALQRGEPQEAVVMDDFIYGEPVPAPGALGVAGVVGLATLRRPRRA